VKKLHNFNTPIWWKSLIASAGVYIRYDNSAYFFGGHPVCSDDVHQRCAPATVADNSTRSVEWRRRFSCALNRTIVHVFRRRLIARRSTLVVALCAALDRPSSSCRHRRTAADRLFHYQRVFLPAFKKCRETRRNSSPILHGCSNTSVHRLTKMT